MLNNSLANLLSGKESNLNAYNGKGAGSTMYINMARTDYGTFAHEIGHQVGANAGTLDMNGLKINLQLGNADWTRIKDETAADNFARKVGAGGYGGYNFTEADQKAYDEAVADLH